MSAATRLPDGRCLALADGLGGRVSCGVLVVTGVVGEGEHPGDLDREIFALCESLRDRHAGREPSAVPELREARTLYRNFGMDPARRGDGDGILPDGGHVFAPGLPFGALRATLCR